MFHQLLLIICGLIYMIGGQLTTKLNSNACCSNSVDNLWFKNIEELILTLKKESCEKGSSDKLPRDCKHILDLGNSHGSGVYDIYNPIDGGVKQVYCDMETDGGGWMVFQRRINGNVSFDEDWDTYRFGFGEVTGNLWLGNEMLYRMTSYQKQKMRVELQKWDGVKGFATYNKFIVGHIDDNFRLNVGAYQGDIGDSLIACHNGVAFSTPDRDNDPSSRNCASEASSGWWFCLCEVSNLNGEYYNTGIIAEDILGVSWDSFGGPRYSHEMSEMKIRPL